MNRIVFLFVLLLGLVVQVNAQHQKAPQQQVPPSPPSMFNLEDFFGMGLDEMLQDMQREMESTRDIWGQFIDPSFMDSTILRLNDPAFGGSLDEIFGNFENMFNDEEGIGGMLDDLLQNFNMPLNTMPFNLNPETLPEDFDGEGWQIIPNVPQLPPSPKQQSPAQKKGVSVI